MKQSYQLRDGIPSFIDQKEFGGHWKAHADMEIASTKIEAAISFLKPIMGEIESGGKNILDAGCGDGVHIEVISKSLESNNLYALDISLPALVKVKNRYPNVNTVHGSVLELPFENNSFDLIFSYGVIAYTGKPKEALKELARTLRVGGKLGFWIYPKMKNVKGFLFSSIRKICRIGGPFISNRIADIIVPFLKILPIYSHVHLGNASWKQCREVVLVNIAPDNLYFPIRSEVLSWISDLGLEISLDDKEKDLTFWVTKKENESDKKD